ncbi:MULTISPECIES: GTP pyrophosphokinase family protein [unclassified Rothia (in: high G+C Gram-positive bacteria)]|uniref:GTP pyrophosphokinase n=1 Tax=unclassified Rothia (in: high G+C Gram-positive bacteria) TaxID=2689056 RepID=UPI00195767BD|nr:MULTISPECIES: GTP pyrophosphokinase family protein [unclassified Rothia (in: high G+C Gram-positive bacteria)]MBM7052116.1 GTP pyrophosphokinase family protein [Rothia sp. ZJ1223]QRZ61451.1 GTP pyrophosphokinase family protein [Rothia sp. ZJ932]
MSTHESSLEFHQALVPALTAMRAVGADFGQLMMEYQFGVNEVMTKIEILRQEFMHRNRYNPIENVGSRIKTPESIANKLVRKGISLDPKEVAAHIFDIAGVRITCSFIADTYRVLDALTAQSDVTVVQVKDYIKNPKPNGYKSLHAIISVPIFLSTGPKDVTVEVQIRTIAMDFWAALEHKIFYKYEGDVPDYLVDELTETAHIAAQLDERMERLHTTVHGTDNGPRIVSNDEIANSALLQQLWEMASARLDR